MWVVICITISRNSVQHEWFPCNKSQHECFPCNMSDFRAAYIRLCLFSNHYYYYGTRKVKFTFSYLFNNHCALSIKQEWPSMAIEKN